jgi:RNA polymerase sigma factor (sigma-70 family)
MKAKSDAELLCEYADSGSEAAFEEIVSRHTNLVYSAALRQVDSPDIAAEIAQSVFVGLARGARSLSPRLNPDASLAGWLCRSARNISLNHRRNEFRRHSRERLAMEAHDASSENAEDWEQVRGIVDDAMSELGEADYDALVLRYFKNQDLRAVGTVLGVSDDAAQKRVSRALEKLRDHLSRRGVTITSIALSAALSGNAVTAAPAGLFTTISAAALAATVLTPAVTTTTAAVNTIAMTTLQKTAVAVTLVAAVGSGIYAVQKNSLLRNDVQSLRQTQASVTEQVAALKAENERLLAAARAFGRSSNGPSDQQFTELMKLRGKAQLNAREIAELKAAIAQNSGKIPEPIAEIMNGVLTSAREQAKRAEKSRALATLKRLSQKSELSPEQEQQVGEILLANAERRGEMETAHATGTLFLENITPEEKIREEENHALAGILSPSQMAAYEQMLKDERAANERAWIAYEKATMKRRLNLTAEQADQASAILSSLKRGEGGAGITYYANVRDQLEMRLRAFEPILTPEQLQEYRKMKTEGIEEKAQFAEIVMALKR